MATLYGRNHLSDIIKNAAQNIFVPLTVGGGIRSIEDVKDILRSGADKVAINTAAVKRLELISEIASEFGSQCVVLYVEAKKIKDNYWEVFTDNARESTGKDVIKWIKQAINYGAGEILLAIDKEGTRKGFDLELTKSITSFSKVPVIANGGMGFSEDALSVINESNADAICMSDILHYDRENLKNIRDRLLFEGIDVRKNPVTL